MKMNQIDALKVFGLNSNVSFDDIKLAYRKACAKFHPDRNPAGLEMMKVINAAYSALQDYVSGSAKFDSESINVDDANLGDEMNAALNAVINLGLTIEICGSWIWVSGDTRPHKEILKEAGYKWAPKKLMWHFSPPTDKRSFSRGKYSIDEIRSKYGSVNIQARKSAKIEAKAA